MVPINPRVTGLVTEVPIEPNRPIKKGDVLFKIDPTPFEIAVKNAEAEIARLEVQLITAGATTDNLGEQLRSAVAQRETIEVRIGLARQRAEQFRELTATGAGNRFDYEQALADVEDLEGQRRTALAAEAQARKKLTAKTPEGEQDEIANVRAQILRAEAVLAEAQWNLDQTTYYAPADGTVVAITLRPGAMAVPFPLSPAMNFVEDEQWLLAVYHQNEVRKVEPGQEAEVAFKMYPGRIVKCKVDSVLWATAQGQLPIGTGNTSGGLAPIPPDSLAVRLLPAGDGRGPLPRRRRARRRRDLHRQRPRDPHPAQGHPARRRQARLADLEAPLNAMSRTLRAFATVLAAAALAGGCAVLSPPTGPEVRQQAGTLEPLGLEEPWRAAATPPGEIAGRLDRDLRRRPALGPGDRGGRQQRRPARRLGARRAGGGVRRAWRSRRCAPRSPSSAPAAPTPPAAT